MAVNASESIQTSRDLTHLEKHSADLSGNRAVYHDLEDFEKSIHNSFSMLMEYRDAPRSPSTSSVTSVSASGLDALSSPTTPASPLQEDMDDEKLPNELLEEICEDMGIKDSMDIDLIDYMMDQTNQMNNMQNDENYCHSDSGGHQIPRMPEIPLNMKGSGISRGSISMGKENMQRMMNPNFQSLNNGGPVPCMAGKMINPGKSSSFIGKTTNSPLHADLNHGFKTPCAPTQLASSVTSNINKSANYHQMPSNPQPNIHGNCMHSYISPITRSCCGGTHHHFPNCSRSSECSNITQRTVTFAEYQQNEPSHNLTSDNRILDSGYNTGKFDIYHPHNSAYMVQPQNKYGRPSPPVVNIQNLNMKMSNSPHFNNSAKLSQSGCLHQTMRSMTNCAPRMFKYDEQQLASMQKANNGRTLESPLDQGYFSGDAASVKSFSSQSSICQSNDILSSQDNMTIKNEQSTQALFNQSDATSNQVIVKTENMLPPRRLNQNSGEHISLAKQYTSSQPSNAACNQSFISCQPQTNMSQTNLSQYGFNINPTPVSDTSQKTVQSKILPRLTHSKDVAPYTVPSNNGQATINPYHEFTQGTTTTAAPQTGLDNSATAVDFPTNFGKESLNAEQQNQYGSINMYRPDYCKRGNTDCRMVNNPNPCSHPSNIHAQQSQNFSHSNFSSPHNSDIGQPVSYPVGHSGSAYPGICVQKAINHSNFTNNSNSESCSLIPNQIASTIKPFKSNTDNRTFNNNVSKQQEYLHETCLMSGSNLITQPPWPQEDYSQPVNFNVSNIPQQQQNAHYVCPRNSYRQSSTTQCIQSSVQSPPLSNPMPHNIEMRNLSISNLAPNQISSSPHPGIHNEHLSQINSQRNCWSTNLGSAGAGNQMSQAMQTVQLPPQAKIPKAGLQHMQFPPHPVSESVSSNCKLSHRPPMLSSQEAFIEHLIMDKSSAYRSHPLFPLLRDLMITYMNFNSQSIHYQLIQHLPSQFERLLQNFLNRNPPRGDYQSNYAVESVIMDALRYAHSSLIEKIRSKQEQDKRIKGASQSITAIEEFCEKFDRSKHNSTIETGACIHGNPTSGGQPCGNQVFCRNTFLNDPTKNSRLPMEVLKEQADSISDAGSVVSSSSNHSTKSESKKHPSLPKEAVAIMLEWLRNHKDNPYPNDDEKAMLIKQTGLTINQINYWFTNARRRILPKWAQAQAQPQSSNSQSPIQLPGHQMQLQHTAPQMQQQQNSQNPSLALTVPSTTSVSSAVTNNTVLSSTSCNSSSSNSGNSSGSMNNNDDNENKDCQPQQTSNVSVERSTYLVNHEPSTSTLPPPPPPPLLPSSSDGKPSKESVTQEDRPSTIARHPPPPPPPPPPLSE